MHRDVQPHLQPLSHRANPAAIGYRLSGPSANADGSPSTAAETWVAGRFRLYKQTCFALLSAERKELPASFGLSNAVLLKAPQDRV